MIVVNAKTYKTLCGQIDLAKTIQKYNKNIILCPSTEAIHEVRLHSHLHVFAQHVDAGLPGRGTGHALIANFKSIGVSGSLLNHSEYPVPRDIILETLEHAHKKKFKIILCIPKVTDLKWVLKSKYKPYAVAFEDPKLIATGNSVTTYNPKAIKKFVKRLEKTKIIPLCGAGVSTAKDYHAAMELGCEGVLLASAIAKVKDPTKLLKSLK